MIESRAELKAQGRYGVLSEPQEAHASAALARLIGALYREANHAEGHADEIPHHANEVLLRAHDMDDKTGTMQSRENATSSVEGVVQGKMDIASTLAEAATGHASGAPKTASSKPERASGTQARPYMIELCCRDFEMSRYLPLGNCRYFGIDLTAPVVPAFEGDHPHAEASDGGCHAEANFTPIKGDLFNPRALRALPKDDPSPCFVYCRPPAQKAISQSLEAVEAAKKALSPYLCARAKRLHESHYELELDGSVDFSLYEWYFVLAAAALVDERPGSVAIIQVPTRVLNLARAREDRRIMLEYGLLDSVILLPKTTAPGCEDSALLCVTSAEPGRAVFTFDARGFEIDPQNEESARQLIAALQKARAAVPHEGPHWRRPLEDDICSLMPRGDTGTFPTSLYRPFSEVAAINRGVSRTAITNLAKTKEEEDYFPQDHYYLSLKPLVDGHIASANDIASPKVVADTDVYDLGFVAANDLARIKCLETRVANLLIARVGPPFKLALVTHGQTHVGPGVETENELLDRSIVPSDNLFFAAIADELLATFLLAYLSSQEGQDGLAGIAHGTTLSQISPKDLRAMRVPIPSKEEQKRYASAYKAKQKAYEQALEDGERCKQSKLTLL